MFIIQMNFESFGQVLRIDSSLQVSFLNQKSGVFQVSRVVVKFCEQHRVGSFFSGLYFNQLYAIYAAAAAAKSPQSCPTLCDPIDGSPPGSPVHGILQARTLEWGAMSFSNAWKWKMKVKSCCNSWGRKESDTTERLDWTELKRMKRKKRSDKRITFFWWKGKEQNVEGQLALKWKILDSKMRLLKPMAKSITWCILDNVPKVIRLLTRLFPRVFCRFIKFFKIKANKCNVYSS